MILSSHLLGRFSRSSIAISRRSARLRLRNSSIRTAKSAQNMSAKIHILCPS